MPRVVHFELGTERSERAAGFCELIFGYTIYFRDNEGNLLGLHESDQEAK